MAVFIFFLFFAVHTFTDSVPSQFCSMRAFIRLTDWYKFVCLCMFVLECNGRTNKSQFQRQLEKHWHTQAEKSFALKEKYPFISHSLALALPMCRSLSVRFGLLDFLLPWQTFQHSAFRDKNHRVCRLWRGSRPYFDYYYYYYYCALAWYSAYARIKYSTLFLPLLKKFIWSTAIHANRIEDKNMRRRRK